MNKRQEVTRQLVKSREDPSARIARGVLFYEQEGAVRVKKVALRFEKESPLCATSEHPNNGKDEPLIMFRLNDVNVAASFQELENLLPLNLDECYVIHGLVWYLLHRNVNIA
jgi:hypothetical protein